MGERRFVQPGSIRSVTSSIWKSLCRVMDVVVDGEAVEIDVESSFQTPPTSHTISDDTKY